MKYKGTVILGWYLRINILSGTKWLKLDGLFQFVLKIHPSNTQVKIFKILKKKIFEMVDYIKETKNNSKICIGVVIFVLFMYMLYTIPIPTIAAIILVGNEALAIFGFQNKKTIPIYIHVVFNYLLLFSFVYGIFLEGVMEEQMDVIDYQKICYVLMLSLGLFVFMLKFLVSKIALMEMTEEQSVLVPLVSNPV